MPLLEYSKWENFHKVIKSAMIACETSNNKVSDHFPEFRKMVDIGSKTKRETTDYRLSRYACYLIVQNANPRKKSVAFGQTYFAVQTRKQEISEREYSSLTEDEKRFYQRNLTKKGNYSLNQAAKDAGVKNFDKFHNVGYKGLRYREDILDNMGSDELIANLFRISQSEQKLKRDNVKGEVNANDVHFEVGKKIRNTIKELGGTMPEDYPTPEKSLKVLEKENKNKITSNSKLLK